MLEIQNSSRLSTIHIASGLFSEIPNRIAALSPSQVVSVLDEGLPPDIKERWRMALNQADLCGPIVPVPAGEASKSWNGLQTLTDACLATDLDRNTVIVALGGGVVGDLAGFAASILLRGLRLVHIPTTLLAMVDSSVGGKTGIDTVAGKNLVGSFYPADLVLIDPEVLTSLPLRHMQSGYAEIIKYGLIRDRDWYNWCLTNGKTLIKSTRQGHKGFELVTHAVTTCCKIKAEIVSNDEKETSGDRALLNLGHTFAHAFESAHGYSDNLLHGEAVAIGLVSAARLSAKLGYISENEVEELQTHLEDCGLPTDLCHVPPPPQGWTADDLIARMQTDKKAQRGEPRFVILKEVGRAVLSQESLIATVREQLTLSCRI